MVPLIFSTRTALSGLGPLITTRSHWHSPTSASCWRHPWMEEKKYYTTKRVEGYLLLAVTSSYSVYSCLILSLLSPSHSLPLFHLIPPPASSFSRFAFHIREWHVVCGSVSMRAYAVAMSMSCLSVRGMARGRRHEHEGRWGVDNVQCAMRNVQCGKEQ